MRSFKSSENIQKKEVGQTDHSGGPENIGNFRKITDK